jgi:hypothetical protein
MTPELLRDLRAQAARAQASRQISIAPSLEAAIEQEVEVWIELFGNDGRCRQYATAGCVARAAHRWNECDGDATACAEWLLDFAADVERPVPAGPAGGAIAVLRDIREKAGSDDLGYAALQVFQAFYWTAGRHERSRQSCAALHVRAADELMKKLVRDQVRRRKGLGAAFARDDDEIVQDVVIGLAELPMGFRPTGRLRSFVPFLKRHVFLRLDDEKRRVGETSYRPRWLREQRARGAIKKEAFLNEYVVDQLRDAGARARRHEVPGDSANVKGVRAVLSEHQKRGNLPGDVALGARSVDKLIVEYEHHRGRPFERVGRSKRIPRAEIAGVVAFVCARAVGDSEMTS